MPDTNVYSHSIQFSIGNTDFQIIFSSEDLTKQSLSNSPEHYHLFCECHFIKTGEMLLKTPTQAFLLKENAFAIVPPNVRHSTEILGEVSERMVFYLVISQNEKNENDTFSTYEHLFFAEAP